MTIIRFLELFQEYGLLLLFGVFFLEYMNFPGLPAGVIMPAAGVLVSQSQLSLLAAVSVSVVAGLMGSLTMYAICYWGGAPLVRRLLGHFPKMRRISERSQQYIERHRGRGLFYCRLVPVLRTIVSIPAGLLRVPPVRFAGWSALGILVWNTVLISFGYLFSHLFIG